MKKKILITGGAGFIGSNLSNNLVNCGYKLVIVDDFSTGNKKSLKKNKNIEIIKKNISSNNIKQLFKNIYCCIHLAAKAEILIDKKKEKKYFNDNVVGLQNILNLCALYRVKKFIFASSASVYGDTKNKKVKESDQVKPLHFYGYTKYLGEKIIKEYCRINNIKFYILRFFNVYGNKSNAVVAKFLAQDLQKKNITIYGHGNQSRDFIHVKDICEVIKKLISKNITSDIFNVGSSNTCSIKELKNLVSKKNKAIFLEKRFDDIEKSISNINKIKSKLNWYPKIDFIHGLNLMRKEDKVRLLKLKIPTIKFQEKIIKKFNITSN